MISRRKLPCWIHWQTRRKVGDVLNGRNNHVYCYLMVHSSCKTEFMNAYLNTPFALGFIVTASPRYLEHNTYNLILGVAPS
jgi:hypothetical protein